MQKPDDRQPPANSPFQHTDFTRRLFAAYASRLTLRQERDRRCTSRPARRAGDEEPSYA